MTQGYARARRSHLLRGWLLALTALGAGGCTEWGAGVAELRSRPLVALGTTVEEGAAIGLDPAGRFWLAAGDSLRVVEPRSWHTVAAVHTGAEGALHIVGGVGDRMYLHTGDRLLALDLATGGVQGERRAPRAELLTLDARGRQLYHAVAAAAVYGLDPRTLEPLWAWPRLGLEPVALAASPEGDRLYLAVRDTAEGAAGATRVLTRDVQSGRLISASTLPFDVRALASGPAAMLYALAEDDSLGAVVALQPGPDGMREQWRVPLASVGLGLPVQLRISPAADQLALFTSEADRGLELLDARSGTRQGRLRDAPRDAAFGADGILYLLYPEEIRFVEGGPERGVRRR